MIVVVLGLFGCAERGPLLVPLAWESTTDDPWGGGPACEWWGFEGPTIELSTEECAWPTVSQPIQHELFAGEVLEGAVLWETLYADQPSQALMGVALGDTVVWQGTAEIPSGQGEQRFILELAHDVEAGVPLFLHVHNHGLNDYRWIPPELVPGGSAPE